MRIAYLCADVGIPIFGFKGASVHVREMISAWQRQGHKIIVFSPSVNGGAKGADKINAVSVAHAPAFLEASQELMELETFLGIQTRVRQDLRNFWYNRTFFKSVESQLWDQQIDFIYERYTIFNYAGVALARRLQVPHILEVNAPLCYEKEKMSGLEMKNLAYEMEKRIFNDSHCVAVVSNQLRDYVESCGVPRERIVVTPNGVNPSAFQIEDTVAPSIRRQLNLDNDTIVMGFVGSLKSWHGTNTLVDAFKNVYAHNPLTHLLIVGDGPERQNLENQVEQAGLSQAVTFTGKIDHDQIPAYIAVMDIAVAPYIPNENFYFSPIKIFEYMAMGKPVVAGGIGQVREVIQEGRNGLLYEPGNVVALTEALGRLIQNANLCANLGADGQKWVLENRTWEGNARNVLEVVRNIIHKEPSIAIHEQHKKDLYSDQPVPTTDRRIGELYV